MPATERKDERRKHTRVKFEEHVKIHPVQESKSGNVFEVQGNPLTVKAFDLSEGGIRLELGIPRPPSHILKVNFRVHKDRTIDVYSKLVWVSDKYLGYKFIVVDEEARKIIREVLEKLS
jgi:c-di-GMP-binding flagellar brake protein YcgR